MWRAERLPRFTNEIEAKAWLVGQLAPRVGRIVPEVWMTHPLRDGKLRMDFALVIPNFRRDSPTPALIGLEAKDGHDAWRQWIRALCQATAYRYGTVADRRSTIYYGQQPSFAFVWPDPRDTADWTPNGYVGWPEGAERLAGRFNVGTIRYFGCDAFGRADLVFTVAANRLWSTLYGPRNASNFGTRQQIGST